MAVRRMGIEVWFRMVLDGGRANLAGLRRVRPGSLRLGVWVLIAVFLASAHAQYPGHIDTRAPSAPSPRAIAVLEWIGQPGKPSASRILPIVVFDGQTYQPGAFYLARPEPLSLDPGTEYILERSGVPVGLFDVNGAEDMKGYWIGYGVWRRPGSNTNPKARAHAETQPAENIPAATGRPVLRHSANSGGAISFAPPGPETPVGGPDPNRPHLSYRIHNPTGAHPAGNDLSGLETGLQQMVGVSDAVDRKPHSFTYVWPQPEEAAKLRAQMETLARQALAARTPAIGKASSFGGESRAGPRNKEAAPKPAISLTDEEFRAYELTRDGGPTVIFSARALSDAGLAEYVTLIAQPDFYGTAHVLFQSVTDAEDLDVQPRMRLVDAVDARGDGQGELLFELRSPNDRQFALFEVTAGKVQQVFATGPIANATANPG